MKKICTFTSLAILLAFALTVQAAPVTILYTGDIQGHLTPVPG